MKTLGGELLCRFKAKDEKHAALIKKHGLNEKKIYNVDSLAKGKSLTFTATGVIDGPLLKGVHISDTMITTHSLVIRGESGTMRYVTAEHRREFFSSKR
jgi:fructose-1,6-bisphosphatase II